MLDLVTPVNSVLDAHFKKRFDDKDNRNRVVTQLLLWLTVDAKKRPVPDLDQRIKVMQVRTEKMVERMAIKLVDGKLVVKVDGSDEDTLKMYRLGTSWFEPNDRVIDRILAGLFEKTGEA